MFSRNFVFALAVLVGTTVGAGIFAIPYVIFKSGLIPGLFYFLILGGAILLLHLFFAEIVLRTKDKHRLIGYAQKYLGRREEILVTASTILGITGSLLAYLIISGDFLKIIFSFSGLSSFYFSLIFWAILSFFIFRGIKLIAKTEFLMNILFFSIIFIIFCFAIPKFNFQNFTLFNPEHIFLPYGVILFALAGWAAIPEIREILKNHQEGRDYKRIIIYSAIIATVLYLVFALLIIGVSGANTSQEALQGLTPFLGEKIIILGALFGVISIAASFLILGNYLKNALIYDHKRSKNLAVFISCGLPIVLFLAGFRQFIEVIGFVGTLIGAIEGVIIILIFKKAKILGDRKPEYSLKVPSIVLYFLIGIFILGALSQIIIL
ncbi:amino acid permease [Candidatus Parcubacteria bacterium]|nr:amino acid permease [Candidatus Parcubacteria bacterium]